jgi:Flp pilus assembly protein TadG
MKDVFAKSRGQMAVLYAGIAAVLLGAVALGADMTLMYTNWQHVQKTADSAAIAGAAFLSSNMTYGGTIASGCTGDNAEQAACTYAVTNDPKLAAAGNSVTVSEPTGNTLKVVATENNLPYYFAKAFNVIPGVSMNTYNVSASATAVAPGVAGTVNPGPGVFPIGLQCTAPCTSLSTLGGEPVHFGTKFVTSVIDCTAGQSGCPATGNWQWLDVSSDSSNGIPTLVNAINNGASGSYSINPPNNIIDVKTGNAGQNSGVSKAVSDRMAKCPSLPDNCTGINPNDIPLNDPCEVIVPALDFSNLSGKSRALTIEGFALVLLDPATTTSTSINGCFVSAITQDTIASITAPDFGALVADTLTQ